MTKRSIIWMSDVLTVPLFFSFCCWFVLVCFFGGGSSFLPARCSVFLFSYFSVLFASVCSSFYCWLVLVFFFLLLSIPAFFFVLFVDVVLWCLKLPFTVTRFVLSPWRTRLAQAPNHSLLYTHLHNNTMKKKDERRLFIKIFTSHFICKVRKGCVGFACERELEIEYNCDILIPHSYGRHVVSFLSFWCSTGGLGPNLLGDGFLYCILSASSLDPKLHRGFRGPPRSGVAFPTTSRLHWNSNSLAGTQLQLPLPLPTATVWLTELNSVISSFDAHSIFEIECLIVIKRK